MCLSLALNNIFETRSLFVLKMLLNTNQSTNPRSESCRRVNSSYYGVVFWWLL